MTFLKCITFIIIENIFIEIDSFNIYKKFYSINFSAANKFKIIINIKLIYW